MRLILVGVAAMLATAPLAADQGDAALRDSTQTTRTAARWGKRGSFAVGTRIQAKTLDRRAITGTLVHAYGLDSTFLRFCPGSADGCSGADSVRRVTIPTDSLRELNIWGRSGSLAYLGAFAGAGAGLAISGGGDSDASVIGLPIGAFVGMFIGSRFDKDRMYWAPVFPCHHGCAFGGNEAIP